MTETVHRGAVLSSDGLYRYRLARQWDNTLPACVFIMLNPSTADAVDDDPTIRRCLGFARTWQHAATGTRMGTLIVVNLYAYRTPSPKAMRAAAVDGVDVVGPENDWHLQAVLAEPAVALVVAAWGAHADVQRAWRVRAQAHVLGRPLHHLGLTKHGQPKHPLYLGAETQPVPWPADDDASAEG